MPGPGLKKPNSKLPPLETKVLPSGRDSDGEMESNAMEAFKKKNEKTSIHKYCQSKSLHLCLNLKPFPSKINVGTA